jgi:hypothetical protein
VTERDRESGSPLNLHSRAHFTGLLSSISLAWSLSIASVSGFAALFKKKALDVKEKKYIIFSGPFLTVTSVAGILHTHLTTTITLYAPVHHSSFLFAPELQNILGNLNIDTLL